MNVLMTANKLYNKRHAGETFPTVAALVDSANYEKHLSAQVDYSWRDLKFVSDDQNVQLASPRTIANMTHWSFGQAARALGAPAGFLRDDLSPQLAADVLNYRISQQPDATDARLLVRKPNGDPNPLIRACTTDSYGYLPDGTLYQNAEEMVFQHNSVNGSAWKNAPTWQGESIAGGRSDRDSWVLRIDGGSIVNDPSARQGEGDMYRAIIIRNSEVGAGAVNIESILFRYICGNWMLWGAMVDRTFRRRHVGSHVLRDVIRELANIAYRWANRTASSDEAIIRGLIDHEIAVTKDGVVSELRALGFSKGDAEASYDRCEQKELASPRSYWGIAQGATRLSQESPYMDDRLALDALAAKVLEKGKRLVAA